jgi:hypothetical protein
MINWLTSFFSSWVALGYGVASTVAMLLLFQILRRGRMNGALRSAAGRTLAALILIVVASICIYASYENTVFQYYMGIQKAPVSS